MTKKPDENKIGDGPVQDIYREHMQAIAQTLDEFLNPNGKPETGFLLLVFPFGEVDGVTHRTNYISNSRRGDVVKLLREQLEHFERQERHQ